MKVKLIQTTFSGGEVDPNMASRTDSPSYYNGVETLRNWSMMQTGGIMRRPGTQFLADIGSNARLLPFTFTTGDEYLFALTNTECKIYSPTGTLHTTLTGCPWTTANIFEVNYAQYADTMYIVHPDFEIQQILRTGTTTFTRSAFSYEGSTPLKQPYFKYAAPSTTLTPSGTSGTITVTTSANHWDSSYNNAGIIIRYSGKEILLTSYVSATVMNATVRETLSGTSASTEWDEQAFSTPQGHPGAITFHENRLWVGGNTGNPSGLFASQSAKFTNFDVENGDDSDAIAVTVAGSQLSEIRHLKSSTHLEIFTDSAEFYVRDSTTAAITPGNISIRQQTPFGSLRMEPLNYDGATVFVQRGSNTVREFVYSELITSYEANSISLLAHHLIGVPIDNSVLLGNATRPETLMFLLNDAGDIAVYHSLRTEKVQGWALWETDGKFKSITSVIDKLFVVAERTINGVTKHYLEKFADTDATTLDASLNVNNGSATTTFSGFTHLASQEVAVVSGNYYLGTYTVSSGGVITIDESDISEITAGLNYTPTLKTLPPSSTQGAAQLTGDPKRIARVILKMRDTLGVTVNGTDLVIRSVTDDLSTQPTAIDAEKEFYILGWNTEPSVTVTQSDPLPLKLLSLGKEVIF